MNTAPKTIKIKIKNADKSLTRDHLIYDTVVLDADDKIIRSLLDDAVTEFGEDPEKISINCNLVVQ